MYNVLNKVCLSILLFNIHMSVHMYVHMYILTFIHHMFVCLNMFFFVYRYLNTNSSSMWVCTVFTLVLASFCFFCEFIIFTGDKIQNVLFSVCNAYIFIYLIRMWYECKSNLINFFCLFFIYQLIDLTFP